MHLRLLCKLLIFSSTLTTAHFVLVAMIALFMEPIFLYFFQRFPNLCVQIYGLEVRFSMFLLSVVQSTVHMSCITVTLQVTDE